MLALLLLAACSSAPVDGAASRVVFSDVRARAMPPGTPASAAFMTVHNPGDAAAIVRAEGDVAEFVELHTHLAGDDGTMRMRPVERIDLPSGETVTLQPGGLHVMLIGLAHTLEVGDTFDLGVVFDDGSKAALSVPVKAIDVGN